MLAPDTPDNRELAALLNNRIRSDVRSNRWEALGYRAAGVVAVFVLGGAGVGLAALGVAAAVRAKPDPEAVARSTAAILRAGSVVTVRGAVEARGEVSLAEGQAVALAPGGKVSLADDARVRLIPDNAPPRPTEAQLKTATAARSGARVATNFTVFKSVAYGKGQVVTGWTYGSSDEDRPQTQYCYYAEPLDTTASARIELAMEGRYLAPKGPAGLDPRDAFNNCVWY